MRITHLTPGTGHFHCGSCLRDSDLVRALRRRGHDVTMMPMYLPFVLDDAKADDPSNERVYMGGVNVYLQQKLPILAKLPRGVARLLDSPRLLRWISAHSTMTDAAGLGPMTLSMVRGESGRQAHEIELLIEGLQSTGARPEVIGISNAMLLGLARRLKEATGAYITCTLQGEAPFLDALPEPYRSDVWAELSNRCADVDAFAAVSRSYGDVMSDRLNIPAGKMHVVHNGIELSADLEEHERHTNPPVIGYLARLCPDKGLGTLVDAFVRLKTAGGIAGLRLNIAGAMLPADEPYVRSLKDDLGAKGFAEDVQFHPNIPGSEKSDFLRSLTVLSVPATYGESFGLFVLEALAHGVPVVQPRHGAFPELLEATGGGILCEPDDPASLADGLRSLLEDEARADSLAKHGRAKIHERFTADHMAHRYEAMLEGLGTPGAPSPEPRALTPDLKANP